jgi:hypothetical protein
MFRRYRPTVRGEIASPSFRSSSSAIRSSPQVGFARAIAMISRRRLTGIGGRPDRDFHRQKSRQPWRCHRISASGLTTLSIERQSSNRDNRTSVTRAAGSGRLGFV